MQVKGYEIQKYSVLCSTHYIYVTMDAIGKQMNQISRNGVKLNIIKKPIEP